MTWTMPGTYAHSIFDAPQGEANEWTTGQHEQQTGSILTGDARPHSTILCIVDELCSRSGGDAREAEAMTVGCKPTSSMRPQSLLLRSEGNAPEGCLPFDRGCQASKTAFRSHCARPTCERGVLSEFRAARTCASYWFDKIAAALSRESGVSLST